MPIVAVTTQKGNGITIVVKDNVTCMPHKTAEKVIQPFFTTKPTGEGTVLGLSLRNDIITKAHNGNLSPSYRKGEGSPFVVEPPVYALPCLRFPKNNIPTPKPTDFNG